MKNLILFVILIPAALKAQVSSLKVHSNGNVGINKDVPTAVLDIFSPEQTSAVAFTGHKMFSVSDGNLGSFYVAENASGENRFLPAFMFESSGLNGLGGNLIGVISESNDVRYGNGSGVIGLQARRPNATSVTSSDVFSVSNYNIVLMTIAANGNTGIGVPAPTERLHVNGNILATGTITPSDKRLKKDIEEFNLGLEEVLQIRPITFTYNGENGVSDTDTEHVGVIAQEFQLIDPKRVKESGKEDSTKYLSVDQTSIIYMLVNAIKEQQKIISSNEIQLSHLVQRIEKLEKTLSSNSSSKYKVSED